MSAGVFTFTAMIPHEHFMQRCVELAQKGLGSVAPNPLVGAVLVHDEKIIGEGWHQKFGEAHAEVNCMASVHAAHQHLIPESTLYVSLEPCNHFGKTPPCTGLILQHQIKNVVVGSIDPNPLVAGVGMAKLRANGVAVTENVLRQECDELNKRFFTFHQKKRPYIILKMAQSADGFLAGNDAKQLWLTNDFSKRLSHKWRTEEQAILVGTKTALIDNPELTARLWQGKNPLRVLIDRKLQVPSGAKIFSPHAPSIVFNELRDTTHSNITYCKIDFSASVPKQILTSLIKQNIHSLIVEGGAFTIQRFVDENLWDEARMITAPTKLGKGVKTPAIEGQKIEEFKSGDDEVIIWRNCE